MPSSEGQRGRPFRDHRQVIEGIVYRLRPAGVAGSASRSARGRRSGSATSGSAPTAHRTPRPPGRRSRRRRRGDWHVSVDSTINRAHQHARTLSRVEAPAGRRTGGRGDYKDLRAEPPDHALGRSRGGMSTKIHQIVDGQGRPLVIALTPGQAGDFPNAQATPVAPGREVPRARATAHPSGRGARRQGLLLPRDPHRTALTRSPSGHPATLGPDRPPQAPRIGWRPPARIRRHDLQGAQRHRAILQRSQALARPGHPLRQARRGLQGRRRPTAPSPSGFANKETHPSSQLRAEKSRDSSAPPMSSHHAQGGPRRDLPSTRALGN